MLYRYNKCEEKIMNENEKKCKGFKEQFINLNENELLAHIEKCESCQKEYIEMEKVSKLLKTVKPHYLKKQNVIKTFKTAAIITLTLFTGFMVTYLTSTYSQNTLSFDDLGFPTDEYGFLLVD